MEQKVIEGTWEEVTRRGQELAGHRVRLTVLDEVALPGPERASNGTHPESEPEETVFDVLNRAGLIGSIKSEPGVPPGPGTSSPVMLDRTLGHLLEDAERLVASLPPAPSADDAWTEGIAGKFRRQGFAL